VDPPLIYPHQFNCRTTALLLPISAHERCGKRLPSRNECSGSCSFKYVSPGAVHKRPAVPSLPVLQRWLRHTAKPLEGDASRAAAAGVLAKVATVRSGSALAAVRFHATTLCPAAANARARAVPIFPVPSTARVSFMLHSRTSARLHRTRDGSCRLATNHSPGSGVRFIAPLHSLVGSIVQRSRRRA
jgi:hypothetical protein